MNTMHQLIWAAAFAECMRALPDLSRADKRLRLQQAQVAEREAGRIAEAYSLLRASWAEQREDPAYG